MLQPQQRQAMTNFPLYSPKPHGICSCTTQWRIGMSGATGLDYNAIRWAFEMYGVSDQREMFEGLQVMEAAALGAMNKNG
jgi:hypothetical protein